MRCIDLLGVHSNRLIEIFLVLAAKLPSQWEHFVSRSMRQWADQDLRF